MRFFFILPEVYAKASWPLSSCTRKRLSGSSSITVPSNSIRSSFAIYPPSCLRSRAGGVAPSPPGYAQSVHAQIDRGDFALLAAFEVELQLLTLAQMVD